MGKYNISYVGREPSGDYLFEIYRDGRKVAELGHDFRGDEHWLRRPGGDWIVTERQVFEGGGPEPLALTSLGEKAVDRLIA